MDSISEFLDKYQRRMSSPRRSDHASRPALTSCNNTSTAPPSNNGNTEIIELLSDSSDDEVEIIDLSNGSGTPTGKNDQVMPPFASSDEVRIVGLRNATAPKSNNAEGRAGDY